MYMLLKKQILQGKIENIKKTLLHNDLRENNMMYTFLIKTSFNWKSSGFCYSVLIV